jgi:hypothetical protein
MRRLFKASRKHTRVVRVINKIIVVGLPRDLYLNLKIAKG